MLAEAESAAEVPQNRTPQRRIWLCADDYGISVSVNTAIRNLIVRHRLNATSVMVAAPTFSRSESLPLSMFNIADKRVAIGLHVTLTAPHRPMSHGFTPLDDGEFPSLGRMMSHAFRRRLDARALTTEIVAQFEAFFSAFNAPPDFVDGHQHVQLLPQVGEALLTVMKKAAPDAWVRQCGRTIRLVDRLSDTKGLLLDLLSCRFRRLAGAYGVRTNPAFAGTYDFAANLPFAELFPQFLNGLPDGGVIMCHPGFVDAELQRLDPLTALREQEYAYLAGSEFEALLASQGVALA